MVCPNIKPPEIDLKCGHENIGYVKSIKIDTATNIAEDENGNKYNAIKKDGIWILSRLLPGTSQS